MIRALSKYKIIEKLGEGGMGEVYKAEDPALLRTVAIKVLSKRQHEGRVAKTRFLQEARAASAINHPNIVTVYEIGETSDYAYIVMEYVQGRTLRDLIASGWLTPGAILKITLQVCDAMGEAHSQRIIHRDIKPENILLTNRDQVKLLDFGLAKTMAMLEKESGGPPAIERLTEPGAVVGTLSYMSPEQLRDESLDERTDLFSFGIVLYEMITGRLPFAGVNSFEVAASILKDEAMKIARLPADMPQGVSAVVMRLLEKDRRDRYPSFTELKRDLESLTHLLARETADNKKPGPTAGPRPPADQPTVKASRPRGRGSDSITQGRSRSKEAASRLSSNASAPPTLLVLPLEPVGSGDDSAFIGIGLAHAITTDLAKISGLSVLSKSAGSGRAHEAAGGVRELARDLGATILLEGEVMRSGQMIGVMARLTDVETGRVIWGSQYRGDAADLFSIQDAVCESVAAALKVGVTTEVRNLMARPATTNIDAFEFYSKGRTFLERWDVEENTDFAIQMFDEALKLDQDFALAYAGLGEAYWQKYHDTRDNAWVERAIAAGDRALALDPRQAPVHVSLGIIYHGTGKIDRAIEEFERAIELQPLNSDAHKWLGRCYTTRGEMERAISYFEKAIEIRPGYWDNYNKLGFCYYIFGRYGDAAEEFRQVIRIQPDNYQGYDNLGGVYLFMGRYEDAAAMHRRAIEIHPNGVSYTNLGTAYFYLGQYEQAIAAYNAAVELDPLDEVLFRNLGDAYLKVGKRQEAQAQFKRAMKLLNDHLGVNPEDARMLADLAICQAKLDSKEEALENIGRATALEPRNTTLMYEQAVVYALTGHTEEAIKYLGRALAYGYSRSEAESDPDLDVLREEPEYARLIAAAK
ncbi:MAG TPA: protein kinase [Blastocatellia bacterium]|nr:protein kinase [Blastocatellia bacterium]